MTNRESQEFFTLRFAKDDALRNPVPRLWHSAKSLPAAKGDKPLAGLRIALDPGHLGGEWAKMEERWFQVGNTQPVQEGDLTLKVARLLAPRLRELGAKVSFVRNSNEPVTAKRPDDFRELARKILIRNGVPQPRVDVLDPNDPEKEQTIRWQSEILFYRYSEIRRRAALVNFKLHPDLVLCLHFNAEGWGDPNNPTLTDNNHLHLLVNGSYLQQELEFDDERFEMIRRLLSRAYDEELPLADTVASAMARETQLAPIPVSDDEQHHQSRHERLRLCAQFASYAALSLSGDLLRALCNEQQRCIRSNSGRRLRRNPQHQRNRA